MKMPFSKKHNDTDKRIITSILLFIGVFLFLTMGLISLKKVEDNAQAVTLTTAGTKADYGYAGAMQEFSVTVSGYYRIECWGVQGGNTERSGVGNYQGGKGGYTKGEIFLSSGMQLYIFVGGSGGYSYSGCAGGWNGGGSATDVYYGASGGGATDIRIGGTGDSYRIMVAGGGGGANCRGLPESDTNFGSGTGGAGGGVVGGTGETASLVLSNYSGVSTGVNVCGASGYYYNGYYYYTTHGYGTGGSQTVGGTSYNVNWYSGEVTTISNTQITSSSGGSGQCGGGGGYYGGACGNHGGAGGGSSYISGYAGCVAKSYSFSNTEMQQGVRSGHGYVSVTLMSTNVTYQNYDYTGSVQTFTAPASRYYTIECWGAQGGSPSYAYLADNRTGGQGGYSKGTIYLSQGTTLYIYVGQAGAGCVGDPVYSTNPTVRAYRFNGGGYTSEGSTTTDWGASGGGATDVRTTGGEWNNSTGLNNRIIVAGGGGAGNARGDGYGCGNGGAGGGLVGGSGESQQATNSYPYPHSLGSGGTQSSAGTRYFYSYPYQGGGLTDTQISGSFGYGGTEQAGGGGGWYGGSGGSHGSAGGGSSYISGYQGCSLSGTGYVFYNCEMVQGGRTGNGYARISWSDQVSLQYNYLGTVQTFTATQDGLYEFVLFGGKGGDAYNPNASANQWYYGGSGGGTSGQIWLTAGTTIYVYVGGAGNTGTSSLQGGWNGGGSMKDGQQTWGGSGGGATDIRIGGQALTDRIMVAGGGGGANNRGMPQSGVYYGGGNGGAGGGLVGGSGQNLPQSAFIEKNYSDHSYGTGGTQTEGGHLVRVSTSTGQVLEHITSRHGNFGQGAGQENLDAIQSGGGGGWYGGAEGGHGGAGGGSSYISGYEGCTTSASGYTFFNGQMYQGVQNGNGYAIISLVEIENTNPSSPTMTADRSLSYYYNSVTVSLSGSSDSQSGFSRYSYQVGSGAETSGSSVTLSASSTSDITLTAYAYDKVNHRSSNSVTYHFDKNNYSISYQLNLDTATRSGNPTSFNVESATITSLGTASATGYTFAGWYTDSGLTSAFSSLPTQSRGNKTYYAKWTPHTYTISYNGNGSTSGSTSSSSHTYDSHGNQFSKNLQILAVSIKQFNIRLDNAALDDVFNLYCFNIPSANFRSKFIFC